MKHMLITAVIALSTMAICAQAAPVSIPSAYTPGALNPSCTGYTLKTTLTFSASSETPAEVREVGRQVERHCTAQYFDSGPAVTALPATPQPTQPPLAATRP